MDLAGLAITYAQGAVPPAAPLLAALAHPWLLAALHALVCTLPMVYAFLVLPLADLCLGEEDDRALPAEAPWHEPFYRAVCYGFVALHCAALAVAAHAAAQSSFTPLAFVLTALNIGISGGFAFTVSHELVHARHAMDRAVADFMLTALCYKHWAVSHIAHHSQVATPEDPASARYKEPLYPFIFRSVAGNWRDAVRAERRRLDAIHPGQPLQQALHSRVKGWLLWPMALLLGVQALFGGASGGMVFASALASIFMLETVNYVEHYGLVRQRLPGGTYERPAVQHSWNANQWFSNAAMLRLQRHTDHHIHASKPFWRLKNTEGAPKLPGDYSMMVLLALLPPAWFAVMNPRVHIHQLLCDVARVSGKSAPLNLH